MKRRSQAVSKQMQFRLISSILEFLARIGVPESAIRDAFERGLTGSRKFRAAGRGRLIQDGSYLPNGDISADLLRLWHRDSRLLSPKDASPRPLHLARGRHSLRSLVRTLDSKADAAAVLDFMKSANLIRRTRDGRYLPTSDAGTITRLDPFVAEHLARSVVRLFGTVRRNTNLSGSATPLIERYAYVYDLNKAESAAFAEFTKSQGLAYLSAVDDWMEQRRVRKSKIGSRGAVQGVVAGVQVVAYLGDGTDGNVQERGNQKRRGGSVGTDQSQ